LFAETSTLAIEYLVAKPRASVLSNTGLGFNRLSSLKLISTAWVFPQLRLVQIAGHQHIAGGRQSRTEGRVAYLEWTAEAEHARVRDCANSFMIENGWIVA
jgi:hypothetical protein